MLDKFKESLSAEEFDALEESIKTLIEEKAKIRAEVLIEEEKNRLEEMADEFLEVELKEKLDEAKATLEAEYETKTAQFKEATIEKLQEHADSYVATVLAEKIAEKTLELEEAFETKVEELEESVLDNLDRFLELEITSKISDELLESVAINETFKPIVQGIQALFESHYVEIDTDGSEKIESLETTINATKAKLDESYEQKMQLNEKVDTLKAALLIATKTEGLTHTQKERVVTMFEGKSFDEVKTKIDTFVEVLEEKETFERPELQSINEDIFAGDLDDEKETEVLEENEDKDEFKFTLTESLLEDR